MFVLHYSPPLRITCPRVLLQTKDNLKDETCSERVINLVIQTCSTLQEVFLKFKIMKTLISFCF